MKKSILKASLCLSLIASLSTAFVSCSNDDDNPTPAESTIDPAKFEGHITSGKTVTLDPSKTYHLTKSLIVDSGATLIIPAGTHIVGEKGATYLLVDRGGKIYINGTAEKPVLFDGAENTPGSWGGIVLLGNAPSNRSAAGTSTSELGDMTYGGKDTTDSSGTINYVIVKNSGFKYNPDKEFNGISLFGCGSGTKVSYAYIADGADDGIESFGGNPQYDHIIVVGVGDDSFDWTEGFSGSASYIYAARSKKYQDAAEPGNRGIEADTQDTDPETKNGNGVSNPTITNATFIGNKKGPESQGLKLRAGTAGKFDNIVIANFQTGLDFETDRTIEWFKSGSYVNNVKFVGVDTPWKAAEDLSSVFKVNDAAKGAGNGTALPDWAKGWTGLTNFDVADAGN